jgi:hypothetical protein
VAAMEIACASGLGPGRWNLRFFKLLVDNPFVYNVSFVVLPEKVTFLFTVTQ